MLNISMQPRLAQRQSLVITPQLQQAITLLQMSNVEICDHAEEVATENPFLHVAPCLPQGVMGRSKIRTKRCWKIIARWRL